ncbi:uncharacterized protein LOC141636638 [Silene latifolia]|uniref:uncharacterized protein LOC141636638 n=1 Tax=Silene latifolia TaxID=37657 RepID=UPI003D78258E
MEDLDDYILTQILLRLPSCATVVASSPVNKRWYSLISDPNFPVQFGNHKKKTSTFLKGSGSNIDEPPFTLVITLLTKLRPYGNNKTNNVSGFVTEFMFGSPKLSLKFLPGNSFIARATFKDLVLCFDCGIFDVRGGGRVYYITNPLTKQWVALPPCPRVEYQWMPAFICQSPYNNTQNYYNFRVVEVRRHHRDKLELVVYCSEIGDWKEINLTFPKEAGPVTVNIKDLETVVCNGIIYFKNKLCLVGFDPFDVNVICDTTLEAKVMPPLPNFGYLLESSGQLLLVHTPNRRAVPWLWYQKDGIDIELQMVVWKLDPNQTPLVWETTFKGLCKGTGNKTESPCNSPGFRYNIYSNYIGVHPYNDTLIYMYLSYEEQLFLCNTRTECLTPLRSFSNYHLRTVQLFQRLEHQWWPTLVPCCAMPHNRAEFDTTTAS